MATGTVKFFNSNEYIASGNFSIPPTVKLVGVLTSLGASIINVPEANDALAEQTKGGVENRNGSLGMVLIEDVDGDAAISNITLVTSASYPFMVNGKASTTYKIDTAYGAVELVYGANVLHVKRFDI